MTPCWKKKDPKAKLCKEETIKVKPEGASPRENSVQRAAKQGWGINENSV